MASSRDLRIDAAKAITMVLVVLGHAKGVPNRYTLLAYSFHVPLFFFLSGWTFRAYRASKADAKVHAGLVRTLLVPYVVFFFVAYAYWLVSRHVGEKAMRWGDVPWWGPLTGLLTGIGSKLYVHPAIWFLPALFVTSLAYLHLHRRVPDLWLALLSLCVAACWIAYFPTTGLRLPFAFDILPVSLFFYACGAWASGAFALPASPWRCVAIAAALMVPWVLIAGTNGRVDINALVFGATIWKFFTASLLGTAMVMFFSRVIQASPLVQWIGRNTLLILCTHVLVFFVLSGIASLTGLFGDGAKPNLAWALFVSVVAIAACVPLRMLFDRFAPWALGGMARTAGHAP